MAARIAHKFLVFPLLLGAYGCQNGNGRSAIFVSSSQGHAIITEANPTKDNDPTGVISTYSNNGPINIDPNDSQFFHNFGTNGRTCQSCHKQDEGWTISATQIQAIFNDTDGLDPLFRAFPDGANRPDADTSTEDARQSAFSLLLSRGVIRIGDTLGLNPPAVADFTINTVTDPYGYATPTTLSFFRRPLPSTSVSFLTHVMWDGREDQQCTLADVNGLPGTVMDCTACALLPPTASQTCLPSIDASLRHQANDATTGHAQATQNLADADAGAIASFQEGNYTAQSNGQGVGTTQAQNANGGPQFVAGQPSTINQTASTMNLYNAWTSVGNTHRQSVANGQLLFNGDPTGDPLINNRNPAKPANFACTGCHNVPNVGNRANFGTNGLAQGAFVDLNLADLSDPVIGTPEPGAVGLPTYTVMCTDSTNKDCVNGTMRTVTDLGRGNITGKFSDIGKFKIPVLRGLASRAPYFHNGSRATLADVVAFYVNHFQLRRSSQPVGDLLGASDQADIVAFLQAL